MKNAIDKFGSQQITDPIFLAGELMFKALSGVGAVTFNPLVFIIGEVGSLLNKKLSNNIEKKRILILFESFKNEIGKIKDELNKNSDYLNSEEFYDLIILSIEKVIRERHKEKIKIYSKLLKGAITSNNIKDFEYRTLTYEEYINIVSQLNIIDIEIIRYAFNSKGKSIQFNLLKHRKLLKNVA